MTADNFNRGFGDAKVVREDIDKSPIGFTVLRRFSHRYSVLLLCKLYNLGFFGLGLTVTAIFNPMIDHSGRNAWRASVKVQVRGGSSRGLFDSLRTA
jgi:hypothetical protein